jgi:hypothetical protein
MKSMKLIMENFRRFSEQEDGDDDYMTGGSSGTPDEETLEELEAERIIKESLELAVEKIFSALKERDITYTAPAVEANPGGHMFKSIRAFLKAKKDIKSTDMAIRNSGPTWKFTTTLKSLYKNPIRILAPKIRLASQSALPVAKKMGVGQLAKELETLGKITTTIAVGLATDLVIHEVIKGVDSYIARELIESIVKMVVDNLPTTHPDFHKFEKALVNHGDALEKTAYFDKILNRSLEK